MATVEDVLAKMQDLNEEMASLLKRYRRASREYTADEPIREHITRFEGRKSDIMGMLPDIYGVRFGTWYLYLANMNFWLDLARSRAPGEGDTPEERRARIKEMETFIKAAKHAKDWLEEEVRARNQ